jgi:hypothetical protein
VTNKQGLIKLLRKGDEQRAIDRITTLKRLVAAEAKLASLRREGEHTIARRAAASAAYTAAMATRVELIYAAAVGATREAVSPDADAASVRKTHGGQRQQPEGLPLPQGLKDWGCDEELWSKLTNKKNLIKLLAKGDRERGAALLSTDPTFFVL